MTDFATDVRLVFTNCTTYNKPESDIVLMCNTLSKLFESRIAPVLAEEEEFVAAAAAAAAVVVPLPVLPVPTAPIVAPSPVASAPPATKKPRTPSTCNRHPRM